MQIVWNFLLNQGVKITDLESLKHTYLIILLLPLVVTIIGIARYIIGLRSLNTYVAIVLTFAFLELGFSNNSFNTLKGLGYGIILLLASLISSIVFYTLVKSLRMHYVPKLTLVITGTSITYFILLFLSVFVERNRLVSVSPFLIIMMIVVTDGFISIIAKKGIKYTLETTFETTITCLLSYIIISSQELQNYLITYPFTIILVIIINIFVGRFIGLRLNEYWRFRKIIFKSDSEIKTPEK